MDDGYMPGWLPSVRTDSQLLRQTSQEDTLLESCVLQFYLQTLSLFPTKADWPTGILDHQGSGRWLGPQSACYLSLRTGV